MLPQFANIAAAEPATRFNQSYPELSKTANFAPQHHCEAPHNPVLPAYSITIARARRGSDPRVTRSSRMPMTASA